MVLLALVVAFIKDLSTDPAALRRSYGAAAVKNAVYRGLAEYGDDFELAVRRSEKGMGAGAAFDSTSEDYTQWYRRTDEEGRDVGYDYTSGEWGDGSPDAEHPSAYPEGDERRE